MKQMHLNYNFSLQKRDRKSLLTRSTNLRKKHDEYVHRIRNTPWVFILTEKVNSRKEHTLSNRGERTGM